VEIEILGAHNAESRDTRLVCILIDGVLVLDAGGLTSGLSLSAQQTLKAILLSHHHYDHVRDVAMLGLNTMEMGTIEVWAPGEVLQVLVSHFMDGVVYPRLAERPTPERPSLRLCPLEPLEPLTIQGYRVLAMPVKHAVPTVGYLVASAEGRGLFYTGDTGPGLAECWQQVSPEVLITEVTLSDRFERAALTTGHLTPRLLKGELVEFRKLRGYLPRVILVHMSPYVEAEIGEEVGRVAGELGADIALGHEGMRVTI